MPWVRRSNGRFSNIVQTAPSSPITLKVHSSGILSANGAEQGVTEASPLMKFSGFIDLSEMEDGDKVVIRQYVRVVEGGGYKLYDETEYVGRRKDSLLYITPKVLTFGTKITFQQTEGILKNFEYSFVKED